MIEWDRHLRDLEVLTEIAFRDEEGDMIYRIHISQTGQSHGSVRWSACAIGAPSRRPGLGPTPIDAVMDLLLGDREEHIRQDAQARAEQRG